MTCEKSSDRTETYDVNPTNVCTLHCGKHTTVQIKLRSPDVENVPLWILYHQLEWKEIKCSTPCAANSLPREFCKRQRQKCFKRQTERHAQCRAFSRCMHGMRIEKPRRANDMEHKHFSPHHSPRLESRSGRTRHGVIYKGHHTVPGQRKDLFERETDDGTGHISQQFPHVRIIVVTNRKNNFWYTTIPYIRSDLLILNREWYFADIVRKVPTIIACRNRHSWMKNHK